MPQPGLRTKLSLPAPPTRVRQNRPASSVSSFADWPRGGALIWVAQGVYRIVDYAAARLAEDPHLWATALFDEVRRLGYDRSYPSFTRALRLRGLRPACEPCHPAKGRPVAVIEHPAGEETQ